MSGLKINYRKRMLVGINIDDSWLVEATFVLSCKIGGIPFMYLGLPIGGDVRRLSFWEPIMDRIRTKLSEWKSRNLSFGGRFFLLKSAMSSLPVYALSFFKSPSGIISSLESFFFGARVRTIGKLPGLIGILFVVVRSLEVWG